MERKYVNVKVPKKSGFDKSFRNLATMQCGDVVPLLCDEVIPNTTVNLDMAINACLPPLASDTFANVELRVVAGFVPTRTLYGGYQSWLTGEKVRDLANNQDVSVELPRLAITSAQSSYLAAGTLSDYLGYKLTSGDTAALTGFTGTTYYNIFPHLAYHKFWADWIRNPQIQKDPFVKPVRGTGINNNYIACLPYIYSSNMQGITLNSTLADAVALGSLRKANFQTDYFTNALPTAQNGPAQKVTIDTTGSTGDMTISALRAANSLQQWLERNSLTSFRLQDFVKGHYNANLSDGVAQRTILLGSGSVPVYTKGIYQSNSDQGTQTNNPFATVAAEYGTAVATGKVSLCHGFTANEPGYIMVLCWLSPKVTYSSGILRQNLRYNAPGSQVDLASPLLQNTGNQPIFRDELNGYDGIAQPGQVFGYTDKYADFMTREDELHGIVRDGHSLQSFALQRTFLNGTVQGIDTSFLQIPATYLDQIAASNNGISGYGCWIDSYLDYKVAMPLAQYSIPSLQDPAYEHGKDVKIQKNGSRID